MGTVNNIAFITWDSPETNYLENLFLPIFDALHKKYGYMFTIIQFSWLSQTEVVKRKELVNSYGFNLLYIPIKTGKFFSINKFVTLFKSKKIVDQYIKEQQIDTIMPRSIMPGMLANILDLENVNLVYDADGLALEERIDFSGLKRSSLFYKFFYKSEIQCLNKAEVVLTRTSKSITHFKTKAIDTSKFNIVKNGKNERLFDITDTELTLPNINTKTKVFLYCGSIGPQYRLDVMFDIFNAYLKHNQDAHFIFLTGNQQAIQPFLNNDNRDHVTLKKVLNKEVPVYINSASICFGLREYAYSMQGVSPIKLGEYLLCGKPIIASQNIGDTNERLQNKKGILLINNNNYNLKEIIQFIDTDFTPVKQDIRQLGLQEYSIDQAAQSYHKALCNI